MKDHYDLGALYLRHEEMLKYQTWELSNDNCYNVYNVRDVCHNIYDFDGSES